MRPTKPAIPCVMPRPAPSGINPGNAHRILAARDLAVGHHVWSVLMTDHPWSCLWKRFHADCFGHAFARRAAAAPAGRWMAARSRRRGGAAFVRRMRPPHAPVHAGESGRREDGARRLVPTLCAGHRLGVGRHRAGRGKRPAPVAEVVVNRHRYRSGASGIVTPPLMPPDGPSMPGLMSNSKISVGSHSVAHEFGMSTTPLMWPCTGAVPRIE